MWPIARRAGWEVAKFSLLKGFTNYPKWVRLVLSACNLRAAECMVAVLSLHLVVVQLLIGIVVC